jgi:predicted DNA-binding transcriptional regulator AlpA
MKARRILRRREAHERLGVGRTKFRDDYEFHSDDDPCVPGTTIPRVRAIPLGPRVVGFPEHDVDALVDAIVKAGGHAESKAKNLKAARAKAPAKRQQPAA